MSTQYKNLADAFMSKVNNGESSALHTLHFINDALDQPLAEQINQQQGDPNDHLMVDKLLQPKQNIIDILLSSQKDMTVRILTVITLCLIYIVIILVIF